MSDNPDVVDVGPTVTDVATQPIVDTVADALATVRRYQQQCDVELASLRQERDRINASIKLKVAERARADRMMRAIDRPPRARRGTGEE